MNKCDLRLRRDRYHTLKVILKEEKKLRRKSQTKENNQILAFIVILLWASIFVILGSVIC